MKKVDALMLKMHLNESENFENTKIWICAVDLNFI